MISKTPKDTFALAARLEKILQGGDVLGLVGPLGAGKTTFVQGLAKSLGIKKKITSPTFILMHSYPVPRKPSLMKEMPEGGRSPIKTLTHIDCYRLHDPQELINIGIHDHFNDPHTLTIIEWADKCRSILPEKTKWITFTYGTDDKDTRLIL